MLITNLSEKTQKLVVSYFTTPLETYDVFIEGYGSTDIDDKLVIRNLNELKDIMTSRVYVVAEEPVEEEPEEVEVQVVEDGVGESEEESVEVIEDKFICDICGAEFGSERGLNTHKHRVHSA